MTVHRPAALAAALLFSMSVAAASTAQTNPGGAEGNGESCLRFAPPARSVGQKQVGIDECRIVAESVVFNVHGQRFRRVEIWLGGTAEGWAMLEKGPRFNYFTDGPEILFPQSGHKGTPIRGIGRYEPPKAPPYTDPDGHGMTVFYPEDPKAWNGKLYITAHGAGPYAKVGDLTPRDPAPHDSGRSFYVGLMIDRGYAVAHTKRSTPLRGGDVVVTLEDGRTVKGYNVSSNAGLILSWTALAQNFVADKLGAPPRRTYFYGHSAGGALGRMVNYWPGRNRGPNGKPVIDGFLIDDSGGGLWLPRLERDGKDVLFTEATDRDAFAKQIDITHQAYRGETGDYLDNKRLNAKLLREKGLGDRHRHYEVRGVSHFDANHAAANLLSERGVDMAGLFAALIDRLDQWVEKDVPPPASKADDGASAPALDLPETACPLGVYHDYPAAFGNARRGSQLTAFAAFDGVNLEPVDGRGKLVDMNGNGRRDRRETVTEAWRRLGLLKANETFDRARYVGCVASAVSRLVGEGLLPDSMAAFYLSEATTRPLTTVIGAMR